MANEKSKCKSCGADIIWADISGKKTPLNFRRVAVYNEKYIPGSNDPEFIKFLDPFYISHFITCPDADKWSKKND